MGNKQVLYLTHWPRVRGLAASAGVWLTATEMEISAALWAVDLLTEVSGVGLCCANSHYFNFFA